VTIAAYLDGPRRISIREFAPPAPAPDEVLVAVRACAVCATDLQPWAVGTSSGQAGLTGHEIAGEVRAGLGAPGRRVCIDPNLAVCCRRCRWCRDGLPFLCADKRALPAWGFSEQMVVPADAAVGVPDGLPTATAVLAEPLACVVHALRRSVTGARHGRLNGAIVGIAGAGTVGLLAIAAVRHAGAARVLISARHAHQRAAALGFGAEVVGEDLVAMREARPEVVIVAAGAAGLLGQALRAVDRGGEVIMLGLANAPETIDARRALLRGNRVTFSISYGGHGTDFRTAIEILAAAPAAFTPLLTETVPLTEVASGFERAAARSERSGFRVLVAPGDDSDPSLVSSG
jgi:threonine dehydrogenase-like Zn-dependent dehydrogenase